jgi:hypothetical protein
MNSESKHTTISQKHALLQAASVLDQSAMALEQHRRGTESPVRAECLADLVISLREISSGLCRLSILLANNSDFLDTPTRAAHVSSATESVACSAGRA